MERGRRKGRDEGGRGEGNEEEEGRMEREIGGARRLEREICKMAEFPIWIEIEWDKVAMH